MLFSIIKVQRTGAVLFYQKHLPATYYELQAKPTLKTAWLPFAADDGPDRGQTYRMSVSGRQLTLRFKYPAGDRWAWTPDFTLTLPDAIDPTEPLAPTLRLTEIKSGQTMAVLDFIVNDASPQGVPTGQNVLAFDWGVRRLLTLTILNRTGEQLTPPVFVNIGGLMGKQARLRREIDDLKTKKAKLRTRDRARVQAQIDACWRKYNALNEMLAHFAANLLLIYALIWGCDTIAGEWLKTLKAKKKKHNHFKKVRTLNWKVNTTIRQLIWRKLDYKAKRYAIRVQTGLAAGVIARMSPLWGGRDYLQITGTPSRHPLRPLVLLSQSGLRFQRRPGLCGQPEYWPPRSA